MGVVTLRFLLSGTSSSCVVGSSNGRFPLEAAVVGASFFVVDSDDFEDATGLAVFFFTITPFSDFLRSFLGWTVGFLAGAVDGLDAVVGGDVLVARAATALGKRKLIQNVW